MLQVTAALVPGQCQGEWEAEPGPPTPHPTPSDPLGRVTPHPTPSGPLGGVRRWVQPVLSCNNTTDIKDQAFLPLCFGQPGRASFYGFEGGVPRVVPTLGVKHRLSPTRRRGSRLRTLTPQERVAQRLGFFRHPRNQKGLLPGMKT